MDASGRATRSTELCEMSRSCHSATSSSPAPRYPRSRRASPQRRSERMGLRLCGMDELPFWPAPKGSSASPSSLRARCLISVHMSSMVAPMDAQAARYSAWRSRAITWVAGTGVRPRAAQTRDSTAGSMLE